MLSPVQDDRLCRPDQLAVSPALIPLIRPLSAIRSEYPDSLERKGESRSKRLSLVRRMGRSDQ